MPKKTEVQSLTQGDVTLRRSDDPAYFALVDVESYAKDLPDWDYGTLTRMIASQMQEGRLVAWGCPEAMLQVRITLAPLSARDEARVVATMRGVLVTGGQLCFASYTSLTMCAQFPETHLPEIGDTCFSVPPGRYEVVVHRFFEHEAGAQFPNDELPPGDHYAVVLNVNPEARAPKRDRVEWALDP